MRPSHTENQLHTDSKRYEHQAEAKHEQQGSAAFATLSNEVTSEEQIQNTNPEENKSENDNEQQELLDPQIEGF